MDVKVNGVWLSIFCKVIEVRKKLMPPREWSTISIPSRAGAYLANKRIDPLIFEVDIAFVGDVETQRRAVAATLESDDVIPVEFEDRPGIEYLAVVIGDPDISRVAHTGWTTIQFLCPDPYGQGALVTETLPAATTTVDVNGDAEAYPVFRVTFNAASSYFAIANTDEKFILVGESPDLDAPVLPYEERVLWDEFDSLTGWATFAGSLEGGTVAGTMATNGFSFYPSSYGSGSGWHGPAVIKSLGTPLQDFLIELNATQLSQVADQTGRVELYLLDTNSAVVAKLVIRDSDPHNYTNYGVAAIGQGANRQTLIDKKTRSLNYFTNGKLRLRRDGKNFSAYIARMKNGRVVYGVSGKFYDAGNDYQAPIAQVVLAIAGYGTRQVTTQRADDLKVWKLNKPADPTIIDRIFAPGDELLIDTSSGLVLKNGNSIVGRVNPQSDFFRLRPGNNALAFSAEGSVSVDLEYRTRWL